MSDIRTYLANYFQKPQINRLIISYIKQNNLRYENLTNDQLMTMLQQLQLLDPLLEQMNKQQNIRQVNQNKLYRNNQTQQQQNYHQQQKILALNQQILQLEEYEYGLGNKSVISFNIKSGRKFKELAKLPKQTKFFISLVGFNQKAKTINYPANQAFVVGENLKFNVYQNQLKTQNNSPFQLSIVLLNPQTGQSRLYSVKLIQWRYLLCYGSVSFEIELAPYYHQGTHQMQPVGVLALQLKLSPVSKLNIFSQKSVQNQLQLQKKLKQRKNNEFYKIASDFWNEYKQVHRTFTTRRVKLYASSEDKIFIPLPKLIVPLFNLKGIQSPNHALRFCSLLQFQSEYLNQNTCHKRYSSTLSNKRGNVDDHCHLLCGMLLGFGLKAYVVIGHSINGEHSWVMTMTKDNVMFWQCAKGQKFDYFSPKTFKFYKSIHVVYNHSEYYANIQLDDSITGTKFNFQDKNFWKSLPAQIINELPSYNRQLAFTSPSLDVYKIQSSVENSLKIKLAQFRKRNKLSVTNFDPILNSILTTALTNYEYQRISGNTFCQEQFQTAIKGYIPLNHTFKAFPIQLTILSIQEIMEQLISNPKCKQIILSKGESLFFGIRCKMVVFPDNVFAVWISLAVRYYKLIQS